MRVLHATAYYAPAFVYGGPPRSIHGLCRALLGAGVDVEVFTTDANGRGALPPRVTQAGAYDGVPVRYFPRAWPAAPIGSHALAAAIGAALPQADLLHIHGLWNRVVWAAAREARRAGVPYVLSPRGMLESAALTHRSLRKRVAWTLVERATIDGAALLHATSQGEYDTLRALCPSADVALVPNGVDIPPAGPAGAREPVIAFIGRLHPIKRLDLLVEAFVRLRASGRTARLVVAGPDEAGLRVPLTAAAGGAAAAIDWQGTVNDEEKAALLARATALVVCSDSESFGLSAAEAMAAGVPVVVTRTCPWPDVERHRAGFWVEQQPEAIAAALATLLDDADAANAMGARGRALIEQKYRWPVVAAELARCYGRVVPDRSPILHAVVS
jgi:glycosyltransferase involved in cell wall biosynthesis